MAEVRIKDNEPLENALRRFKRQVTKSGIMGEVRKREHYEKPSVKRKKKSTLKKTQNYLYLRFLAASDFFLRFTLGFS